MSRDALVVGINRYQWEGLQNLRAPARDAEAIAQMLEKHGDFRVWRLPEFLNPFENNARRVHWHQEVTLEQLEEAVVRLFKPEGMTVSDTALLFFSGHGLRKERGIPEGFLATSDVNPEEGKWGLSLQWLRRLLQASPVQQQIVWLDCCYSGEALNFRDADPGYRGEKTSLFLMAASREFEPAYETSRGQQGAFTAALLDGLNPRQQPSGVVTNDTLIEVIAQQLKGEPQRPLWINPSREILLTGVPSEILTPNLAGVCPYKGLRYFDIADAPYFYGRENLTDHLLDQVKVGQGNFVTVLGASGSGKSSLVRAGLLHQLQQGHRISGSEQWRILILTPGEKPLENLEFAFLEPAASDVERAEQLQKAEVAIQEGATGLARLIKAAKAPRTVLFIDQFEEAFTLCQNLADRQKFFACLLGALEQTGDRLCLIITMRADFLGKCTEQNYSGLADQIQSHLVTVKPMIAAELEQAIRAPARLVGLRIENHLVTQILSDLSLGDISIPPETQPVEWHWEPGSLPLLEYTLEQLWQHRTLDRLTLDSYVQLGGVKKALEKRANDVYESFQGSKLYSKEQQQSAVQHIFLSLTQLGQNLEDTRRQVRKQDLVDRHYPEALIEEVLQQLADAKLVVTSDEQIDKSSPSRTVAVVDIAHEALIRHWYLLRGWLQEERSALVQKQEIEDTARKWREKGKAKDYLLKGKPLRDAINFRKGQAEHLYLSNLAEDLIQSSIQQRRKNNLKLLSWWLVIPLGLAIITGVQVERNAKIKQSLAIVEDMQGQVYSPARIIALQELANLGVLINNIDLSKANLAGAELRGAKLRGCNLNEINLQYANLSRANLSQSNLQNADLTKANLQNANLRESKLQNANLRKSKLENANLQAANLNRANLSEARLIKADLSNPNISFAESRGVWIMAGTTYLNKANLSGATLRDAKLSGTSFIEANLSNAYLYQADLHWQAVLIRANLTGANLEEANLRTANLREANLSKADLSKANLRFSKLNEANLSKANLSKANLREAILDKAILRGANLLDTNLGKASLDHTILEEALYSQKTKLPENLNTVDKQKMYLIAPGSNLSSANLANADLEQVNLQNANLFRANLQSAHLFHANLHQAVLHHANLHQASLSWVNLRDADLSKANLSEAHIEEADLRNADLHLSNLRGARLATDFGRKMDLRGANFTNADLAEANLAGANLRGANLSGANLSRATLNNAKLINTDISNAILCDTKMPDGTTEQRDCEKIKVLKQEGKELIEQGNFKEAVIQLKRLVKIYPSLRLDIAQDLLDLAEQLVKNGEIPQAVVRYQTAQKLASDLEISAYEWYTLCWFGSLHNHADEVMFACEKAVSVASEDSIPLYRGSRGLARALTGNTIGAIEDFQTFVESYYISEEVKAPRQRWLDALRAGKNPFTKEELESWLKEELESWP